MVAEIIVLKSGYRTQGEIILQNEDVVIIKKKDGTRYQYPQSEIQSIQKDLNLNTTTTSTTKQTNTSNKIVAIRFQTHGGTVYLPNKGWGGQVGADLVIGTKQIAKTPILVGGSVGFRTMLLPKENYTFIPIQAVVSMPFTEKQHAPYMGISLGYGCSTQKTTKGGICLSASTGWKYQVNQNLSLLLSTSVEWQNTQTEIIENIGGLDYKNNIGCNFLSIGVTVSIQF